MYLGFAVYDGLRIKSTRSPSSVRTKATRGSVMPPTAPGESSFVVPKMLRTVARRKSMSESLSSPIDTQIARLLQ